MSWCGLVGHDPVIERFRCSLRQGRLASTFLFVGPPGIGKRQFALRLAQGLLCERSEESDLAPCGACSACLQVEARSHPDVELVSRPEGMSNIPLKLLIGDREHRSQEGLCHWISLRPSSGRRRIAIIDDADHLNQEGANCLLKTLEEPPRRCLLILIGTSLQRQLPTIRSRCQIVRFHPLPADLLGRLIREADWNVSQEQIDELLRLAEGSFDRAREFADPALSEFAHQLLDPWFSRELESTDVAKQVLAFVNAAGSDAPSRRKRLRHFIEWVIYRQRQMLHQTVARAPAAAEHDACLELETINQRLDRCVVALQQIDANANLATLIECWVDDLGQPTSG